QATVQSSEITLKGSITYQILPLASRLKYLRLVLMTRVSRSNRRCQMFRKVSALVVGAMLMGGVALAAEGDRKDLQVFNDIQKTVNRYVYFTIFDDVSANVKDGVVTLTGKVTMPYKRDDIAKRVAKVEGVRQVKDQITVLPVSQFDDELR